MKIAFLVSCFLISLNIYSQNSIPKVFQNIEIRNGNFVFIDPVTKKLSEQYFQSPAFTSDNFRDCLQGTATGIRFEFRNKGLNGKIFWGMYSIQESNAKYPIFFKQFSEIKAGKADINILSTITKIFDIADFYETGKFKIGYRVVDDKGQIIYDGKANFKGKGPFDLVISVVEGPFLNMVTHKSAVINFLTNYKCICSLKIDGRILTDSVQTNEHIFEISDLSPNKKYEYTIVYGDNEESSSFKTAPKPGSNKPFSFAFASDCRQGNGGGERGIYGVNAYILKKITAFASMKDVAFLQFTGDLIQGYVTNPQELRLQYTNFLRTVEPYTHRFPLYAGMGNHESIGNLFKDGSTFGLSVDKFPFEKYSQENQFADVFVNFQNGPESEDGSELDPDLNSIDFPSYKENVYHYRYDNAAVIVLNSDYLYTANATKIPLIGGNPHGYIMDNQLKWLESVLNKYESDKNIDHIFVSVHTPAFPNGGHMNDAMWYDGNNDIRPVIAGKAAKKGMIERRDEFLDLVINKSKKTVALLCGDEHNYSRLNINSKTNMYPENWNLQKLELSRSVWQITNGSAGAPYYSAEVTPWKKDLKIFSTQYALCFFHIKKDKVTLEVINPDTLEEIETVELR